MDEEFDWDEAFADDPDYQALDPAQRDRLLALMERMLETGLSAVYGVEDEGVPDSDFPCGRYLERCRARCCSFIFALTKEEVRAGHILTNPKRPYFVARDADGFCPHLDRQDLRCRVYAQRPLRCRRYDCRNDPEVWPQGLPES
ncbi:YkgJ family cysteine cluster protein [Thiohalobacter sp. IOR34]|uniref:YkgJ family cysteine cluster protein n=1 Tax=Thiohalobacter sp. IOR34 TaxID=3057176 RepID=UPI0025AFBF95|nr:YkgJ family cysteine cluster protein [Thiohalobacter sp. IOR34]WJW76271.1 YkgJ family cysteine cluster protein [Thiohalobacter sp. IOR34]